jgi:hypothetical protein
MRLQKYTSRPWPILSLNLDRANGMASYVSTRRSKNLHNPGSVLENFAGLRTAVAKICPPKYPPRCLPMVFISAERLAAT